MKRTRHRMGVYCRCGRLLGRVALDGGQLHDELDPVMERALRGVARAGDLDPRTVWHPREMVGSPGDSSWEWFCFNLQAHPKGHSVQVQRARLLKAVTEGARRFET